MFCQIEHVRTDCDIGTPCSNRAVAECADCGAADLLRLRALGPSILKPEVGTDLYEKRFGQRIGPAGQWDCDPIACAETDPRPYCLRVKLGL